MGTVTTPENLIRGAVRAIRINSPVRFTWLGRRSIVPPKEFERVASTRARREFLVEAVTGRLYRDFYRSGQVRAASSAVIAPRFDGPFVSALVGANGGTGPWDEGWVVVRDTSGGFLVEKDGLTLRAPVTTCRTARKGDPLKPGARVRLHVAKERLGFSPGFYTAMSDEAWPSSGRSSTLRVYWHLSPDGAVALVRFVTEELNQLRVAFVLKVLDDRASYDRCDACVLYLLRHSLTGVRRALEELYRVLEPHAQEGVPALSLQVGRGVGLADDPPDGASFGLARCRLIAEGVVAAHEQGLRALDDRVEVVFSHFRDAGIDPARPHLNPGSTTQFAPLGTVG